DRTSFLFFGQRDDIVSRFLAVARPENLRPSRGQLVRKLYQIGVQVIDRLPFESGSASAGRLPVLVVRRRSGPSLFVTSECRTDLCPVNEVGCQLGRTVFEFGGQRRKHGNRSCRSQASGVGEWEREKAGAQELGR